MNHGVIGDRVIYEVDGACLGAHGDAATHSYGVVATIQIPVNVFRIRVVMDEVAGDGDIVML